MSPEAENQLVTWILAVICTAFILAGIILWYKAKGKKSLWMLIWLPCCWAMLGGIAQAVGSHRGTAWFGISLPLTLSVGVFCAGFYSYANRD